MIFRRLPTNLPALFLCVSACLAASISFAATRVVWPTPHPAFLKGESYEAFAQATASGDPASALFGCVRNNGRRFHEGLDITPYQKRRRGEATDDILAAMAGRVAYINRVGGNSGYGRYVVLEHPTESPAVYTLYAHLASVRKDLSVGTNVSAGEVLGLMGRSALYSIPQSRAHLHFEVGLRMTDDFQRWYDRQKYREDNFHGLYNGMNLLGFDPLDFFTQFRDGHVDSVASYFSRIPTGFVLEVRSARTPDFVRRYPSLVTGPAVDQPVGWEVTFSGWGLPLRMRPLGSESSISGTRVGTVRVAAVNPRELTAYACREMIEYSNGEATLGDGVLRQLQLLFGFE